MFSRDFQVYNHINLHTVTWPNSHRKIYCLSLFYFYRHFLSVDQLSLRVFQLIFLPVSHIIELQPLPNLEDQFDFIKTIFHYLTENHPMNMCQFVCIFIVDNCIHSHSTPSCPKCPDLLIASPHITERLGLVPWTRPLASARSWSRLISQNSVWSQPSLCRILR